MTTSPPLTYHASDGAAYQVFLGRWTEVLAPVFLEFARIGSDGDVLDAGCGTGSLAAEVGRRRPNHRVVGLDRADAYLAYTRARHALPNLHFEIGEAGRLPFADGAFAASLSQLLLTFVTDAAQAVAERVRVTRSGGVVASAVWDFCGGLVYQRILWDTAAALDPQAGQTRDRQFSNPLSTADGLGALWQTAGLTNIEVGSLTIRMNYEGVDELYTAERLDDLLPRADFVIMTIPQTPVTEGLVDRQRLRRMRSTAFLINVGRGMTVRLDDLVAALKAGEIAGAGLDVFGSSPCLRTMHCGQRPTF